jgi:hypothetical protein
MARHKLGFRNLSALEQLEICDRTIAGMSRSPEEHHAAAKLTEATATVTAARASYERVERLKLQLRAEVAERNRLLHAARQQTTWSAGMMACHCAANPGKLLAAGLQLEQPKLPIGKPDAPLSVCATAHALEGAVHLRWKRPVRRCTFEIECRTDARPDAVWVSCAHVVQQSTILKGLESGVKYQFRVRAINSHGFGPWSQTANVRVA